MIFDFSKIAYQSLTTEKLPFCRQDKTECSNIWNGKLCIERSIANLLSLLGMLYRLLRI